MHLEKNWKEKTKKPQKWKTNCKVPKAEQTQIGIYQEVLTKVRNYNCHKERGRKKQREAMAMDKEANKSWWLGLKI